MRLEETLTKENFWNDLEEMFPKSIKFFRDWLDEYKKQVNWEDLFGGVQQRKHYWADIKFHHIPYAMQQGIWIEFVDQNLHERFDYSFDLREDIKTFFSRYENSKNLSYRHNLFPKFNELETVTVSGSLTGVGDVTAWITQIEFSKLTNEYFYTLKSETDCYYSQEKFLSSNLKIKPIE